MAEAQPQAPAEDHRLAADLARAAGELVTRLRQETPDAADVSRRADLAANDFLVGELARVRPADAVLSEEAPDDGRRFSTDRCWIVDPLDGSREFGEGRDDWAVHVALVHAHVVVAAAVALPGRAIVLSTEEPHVPAPIDVRALRRIVVSCTRAPAVAAEVARLFSAELVPMGSAGAKTAAVVLGDADAYIHAGGQSEWDSAAPVGVALSRGLHASRLDGSPLVYNQEQPLVPDLLICHSALAGSLLAALSRAGGVGDGLDLVDGIGTAAPRNR